MEPGETAAGAELDPAVEQEWRRLRRQLELTGEGFWLAYVFASAPSVVEVLRKRTELLLHARAKEVVCLQPTDPSALAHAWRTLLDESVSPTPSYWLQSLDLDPFGVERGPWALAWTDLIFRLNERRDALRRHLTDGLIVVAPATQKALLRNSAPDLWSVRALVLDLPTAESLPAGPDVEAALSPFDSGIPEPKTTLAEGQSPDPEFAEREAQRLLRLGSADPRAAAAAFLRAVDGWLARGKTGAAVEAALRARELLRSSGSHGQPSLVTALEALSRAAEEDGDGDVPKVIDDLTKAWRITADLALEDRRLGDALAAAESALALSRRFATLVGTRASQSSLIFSIQHLGVIAAAAGEARRADEARAEAEELQRSLDSTT